MSSHSPARISEPAGPFRADMIRDGDPYELSNGHPIRCMGAGHRHAVSNAAGANALSTDPIAPPTAVDPGIKFNDDKNLRAPDIALGAFENKPGWARIVPPLVVEYSDTGQDEAELQKKITELLELGVRYIWVVRLAGPLRVEVYEPGKPMQRVDGDGELRAPGVLQNAYPVRTLVDPQAAMEASLRNLLNRKGYSNLDEVRAEGEARGRQEALLTLLRTRGLPVSEQVQKRIQQCTDPALLDTWLQRAVTTPAGEAIFEL